LVSLLLLGAAPAHAELVFFTSGRTMSVKSHRFEGTSLVLTLRSGGEVVCEPSLIASIEQDEVPYPEAPDAAPAEPMSPHTIQRLASRYGEIIDKVSADNGVDAMLVRAVIQVESAYRPTARSRKGAMGLMQLMPATARQYGVKNPYDPESNIKGGIKHLKMLLARFPKALALAAYNAGETAVERFGGIPPYPETRAYVSRVLALAGS
jgi:soluble lytic murein transglycosylase-like protein